MGERLTKEREAEIRRVVDKMSFCPTPSLVRDLLAELDALRAAPPTTYLHADGTEEPIGELVARLTRERDEARRAFLMCAEAAGVVYEAEGRNTHPGPPDAVVSAILADARRADECEERAEKAEARVRELEAGRDAEHAAWLDAYDRAERHEEHINEIHASFGCEREWSNLHDCGACAAASAASVAHELADLAETRAQLARLRDVIAKTEADIAQMYKYQGWRPVIDALRAAISTPGPTLAEIERAAQVRALMDAEARWMADHAATPEAVAVADWLRKRADDLEAGRE